MGKRRENGSYRTGGQTPSARSARKQPRPHPETGCGQQCLARASKRHQAAAFATSPPPLRRDVSSHPNIQINTSERPLFFSGTKQLFTMYNASNSIVDKCKATVWKLDLTCLKQFPQFLFNSSISVWGNTCTSTMNKLNIFQSIIVAYLVLGTEVLL